MPIVAGFIALALVNDGPATCDPTAMGPKNGVCRLPVNPSDAPSSVVIVPANIDHHVPTRLAIVGVGLVASALLFGFVARVSTRTE